MGLHIQGKGTQPRRQQGQKIAGGRHFLRHGQMKQHRRRSGRKGCGGSLLLLSGPGKSGLQFAQRHPRLLNLAQRQVGVGINQAGGKPGVPIRADQVEPRLSGCFFGLPAEIMELTSIGKNIRKFRHARSLRLEDLAEKAGLSVNYVGALEREEKFPSLGSFILIANALEVSADLLLTDVLTAGYTVKESLLAEKLDGLSVTQRNQVYTVLDVLLQTIQ